LWIVAQKDVQQITTISNKCSVDNGRKYTIWNDNKIRAKATMSKIGLLCNVSARMFLQLEFARFDER